MIELRRTEERFIVPSEAVTGLLDQIQTVLSPVVYSEKPFVQTVYIGDDEYSVPWGVSLKARRYLRGFQGAVLLEPEAIFNCEIKREESAGSSGRIKEKRSLTLDEFMQWVRDEFPKLYGVAIRSHLLTQYYRYHFAGGDEALRLTFDWNIRYGFFTDCQSLRWLGGERGARVEMKTDQQSADSPIYQQVVGILESHGAFPVISKKEQGYNLVGAYLDTFGGGPQKELVGMEIEAKFEVAESDYQVFLADLKAAFARRDVLPGR